MHIFVRIIAIVCLVVGTNFSIFIPHVSHALSIDELQAQIETKRKEKEKLDTENKQLQVQIQETGKQAQTLSNTVKVLDTTQKKLQNDIKITQTQIVGTSLTINQIGQEIDNTIEHIETSKEAISEAFRNQFVVENQSVVENILSYKTMNEVWNSIETIQTFQSSLRAKVSELSKLKKTYEDKKSNLEGKKKDLVGFESELADRRVIVEQNKQTKTTLLNQTKSKETVYKELLAKNVELGKKFEQELFDYEFQLKVQIDKSKLPTKQSGALVWPLDRITITQRFGKTVDAQRLYVSGTHNGVDFGVPVGNAVKSISGGVVSGTGNTDSQTGCYSYGRWILVKHDNGLTSLYAHLSGSRVAVGQVVSTGETIGYSGGQPGSFGSGYSTGPHLHLSVFATQGVSVQQYTQSRGCKQVSIPIAAANAYLDPLMYLPPL